MIIPKKTTTIQVDKDDSEALKEALKELYPTASITGYQYGKMKVEVKRMICNHIKLMKEEAYFNRVFGVDYYGQK